MATRTPRILAAVDSSPRAPLVLNAALRLARERSAELVLLRAVGLPLEVPPEAFSLPPARLPEILEARARADLEKIARELPAETRATIMVKVGVAWEVICRVAHEADVDLIVLGSHGFSGIDRLIGTTAARVVNHADRSVLVVRAAPAAAA
jgi:nucleotide-binding universal stress UspA family protein